MEVLNVVFTDWLLVEIWQFSPDFRILILLPFSTLRFHQVMYVSFLCDVSVRPHINDRSLIAKNKMTIVWSNRLPNIHSLAKALNFKDVNKAMFFDWL